MAKAAAVRHVKNTDHEPTFGHIEDPSLSQALNWYSKNHDSKDSKKYFIHFLNTQKYPKKKAELIKQLPDWHFITVGFVVRIWERGAALTQANFDWVNKKTEELYEKSLEIKTQEKKEESKKVPTLSIQDRTEAFTQAEFIDGIERAIDKALAEKTFGFNAYEYLTGKSAKANHAKIVKDYYSKMIVEIDELLEGEDEQLLEGYSFLTKRQQSKYRDMIQSIIDDAQRLIHNGKATRKPRKKKVISVEKVISKVKYKKADPEFKLVSVSPTEIIGAKQVWVFNTKYRMLGVYNSDFGMSIKGTTLQGFTESSSIQMKLRKPLEVLPKVVSGRSTGLKNVFSGLTTTETPLTGRLNGDVIILRVIK